MKQYLLVFCGFIFVHFVNAQNKKSTNINAIDKLSRCQGYWKIFVPAGPADYPNYVQEGFYFNNKKIGVWTTKTKEGVIIKEDIYYDTLDYKVEKREYYLNHNKRSIGFEMGFPIKDSTYVYDIIKRKKVMIYSFITLLKDGQWHYYHENGKLESEGGFEKDIKKGEWKYYDENGRIIKTENF